MNLKPLLPGHVLVSPLRKVPRLTDLSHEEVADLFTTVQKVERMLAHLTFNGQPEDGSFNIAIQDGEDAGQTVPHVHCHIIPRKRDGDSGGDEIYDKMASEEGNVGGALWDQQRRPKPSGAFPRIEDADRKPRSVEEMKEEAELYRQRMISLEK